VQFVTVVSFGFADRIIVVRKGQWMLGDQNVCVQGAGAIERPLRAFLLRDRKQA